MQKFISTTCAVLFVFGMASEAKGDPSAEDSARIKTVIQAIGIFADLGQFAAMCQLYDEMSVSDYSSLWGNEPRIGTPSTKATGWSGFIPGFDTTRHDILVNRVAVDGRTATASARVQADHWLDGEFWGISGTYDVGLKKKGDRWLISTWVFTLDEENGSRDLVDEAEARAADMIERPIICSN